MRPPPRPRPAVLWSIYSQVIGQLGDLDTSYITSSSGEVMTIPQYLSATFQFEVRRLASSAAPAM